MYIFIFRANSRHSSNWNCRVINRISQSGVCSGGSFYCRPIITLLLIAVIGSVSRASDLGGELRKAAEKGQTEKVQAILEKGAGVNSTDKAGNTALILSAKSGHIETVKLLLDKGADVNAMNKSNRTALIEAAFSEHFEILKLLLDKGADLRGDHTAKPESTPKGCCFVPPGYRYRS
jgi:ankyrin repeat protein